MARTSLDDLLDGEPEPQPQGFPRPPAGSAKQDERTEPKEAPAAAANAAPAANPKTGASGRTGRPRSKSGERRRAARRAQGAGPKWAQMERKDARLRDDQMDELTVLTRRLNRARGRGQGERITENTLLRVAVDVLIDNADLLAGDTEDDLADAITTRLRELRTSGA